MKLIVISHPEKVSNEAEHIQQLFDAGLEVFHLRKQEFTETEFEKNLKQLPPSLYKRIVIHNHYRLVEKYNLKGIHLTGWFMKNAAAIELNRVIAVARKRRLSVSGSFHSIAELEKMELKLDYVFVGPVFNSISKKNYLSTINFDDASKFLTRKRSFDVIALGGIDESNIAQVKKIGFDGAALLGSIWNAAEPANKFQMLKKMAG